MGILDDVASKAKDVASVAGKTVNSAVEVTKNRYKLIDAQSDIKHSYEKLGRAVYNSRKSKEESADQIENLIEEIDSLYEKIAELEDEFNEKKGKVKCSNCGTYNAVNNKYCTVCGEKL